MTNKRDSKRELQNIEDALLASLMDLRGSELEEELRAEGLGPNKCATDFEDAFNSALVIAARARLDQARSELAEFKAKGSAAQKKGGVHKERLLSASMNGELMIAARKGTTLSDSDMEFLLEDLEDLDALEQ